MNVYALITDLTEALQRAAQDFPASWFEDVLNRGEEYLRTHQQPGETMTIKPENNVVMVRIRPRTEKVGNLFVAPDPKRDDPADKKGDLPVLADVLAVGPGHRMEDGTLIPMRLKVGQVVLCNGLGGIPVLIPGTGETVWFMREKEFLAVVEDAPSIVVES